MSQKPIKKHIQLHLSSLDQYGTPLSNRYRAYAHRFGAADRVRNNLHLTADIYHYADQLVPYFQVGGCGTRDLSPEEALQNVAEAIVVAIRIQDARN